MFKSLEETVFRDYCAAMEKQRDELQATYIKLKNFSEEPCRRNYIELVDVLYYFETSIEDLNKSIGKMGVFIQDRRR